MNIVVRFIENACANPKTTAVGLAGVSVAVFAAVHSPAAIATPAWWTGLLTSVGLVVSADQAKG